MPVTFALEQQIAQPAAGMDYATRFDGFLDGRHQAVGRSVSNASHADATNAAPVFLGRNRNHGLGLLFAVR